MQPSHTAGSLLDKPDRTVPNPFHLMPFISRVFVRFPCSCISGATFFVASLLLIYLSSFITTRSVTMAGLKVRMEESLCAKRKKASENCRCQITVQYCFQLPYPAAFPPKFTPMSTRGQGRCRCRCRDRGRGNGRASERNEGSEQSILPLVGFDTSNNLLGFRLKSYR